MEVKCPRCSKPSLYSSSNQWRPFCSERCKLIDFGNWASGSYAIAGPNASSNPLESAAINDSTQDPDSDHDDQD